MKPSKEFVAAVAKGTYTAEVIALHYIHSLGYKILTPTGYGAVCRRIKASDEWSAQYRREHKCNGIPLEAFPAEHASVTNAMRGQVELYDFLTHPPKRYMVYVDECSAAYTVKLHSGQISRIQDGGNGKATTWVGDNLGVITFGREYKSNFGDRRVPVTIDAINGIRYVGTYYRDAGSYARVRAVKAGA